MIGEQDSGMLSPGWADTDVEVVSDRAWIDAALRVESALAHCQARAGIIPASAANIIEHIASQLRIDPRSLAGGVRTASNPAIELVQQLQRATDDHTPGTSDYVHLGATSQDILDSASMLVATNALLTLEVSLGTIRQGLVALIEEHGNLPMAGRTVSQHAVPITFGVKASAWLNAIIDAEQHVSAIIERGLPLSLAGASGTLAAFGAYGAQATGADYDPFPLVTDVAEELGLHPHYQPWHTIRTPIAELGSALALVSGAFGKIAADVHVMSRTEIAEVSEGHGADAGFSSSMPQKRNPVATVLVLAAARQVPAHTMVLHQAMVAEDERTVGAWQSEWQPLREALRLVLGSATHVADMVGGLVIDGERMLENLRSTGVGVVSERLNATLMPLLGKLRAKQVLRELMLADDGDTAVTLAKLRSELARLGVDTAALDLEALLDPRDYLGASAEITRRALQRNTALDNR